MNDKFLFHLNFSFLGEILPVVDKKYNDYDQASSLEKNKSSGKEVISAEQAEDLRMKEKRKREREVIEFPNFVMHAILFVYIHIKCK